MSGTTVRARNLRIGDVARLGSGFETVARIEESDDREWLYVYTEELGDDAAHHIRPHHLVDVESRPRTGRMSVVHPPLTITRNR